MKIEKVGNVFVFVSDSRRALAFYRDTLGVPLATTFKDSLGAEVAIFFTEPTTLGIGTPTNDKEKALVGKHTGITFFVDDIEAAYEELKKKGVRFSVPLRDEWWGRTANLLDPDGNEFSLAQLPWRF